MTTDTRTIKVAAFLKALGKTSKSELATAIKETTRVSSIRIRLAVVASFDGVRDGGTWDDAYSIPVEDFTGKFFHGLMPVSVNRNPFRGEYTTTIGVTRGTVLIRHGMSCGKDIGLVLYVHPLDMAALCGGSDTRQIGEAAILADSLFDDGQEAASNRVRAIFCD